MPDERGGGATRNAVAIYDLPRHRLIHHLLPEVPLRTSSLRGLGAWANVFAIESFIDELAEIAGEDPVSYRLSLLSDPRARRVVETAAQMSGWFEQRDLGEGRARGFGFARYKNIASFAAVVAEVEVDEEVRLKRVWCAADAGLVIAPDGAKNQIEGGIIMGASFVMKERVRFEDGKVATATWEDYPILRFSDVPEIEIELIDAPNEPALGLGEASVGPTGAAIGNAVARALGQRIRDLPLTRERIMATLLTQVNKNDMREDVMSLRKRAPSSWLVLFPTNGGKRTSMQINPTAQPSGRKMLSLQLRQTTDPHDRRAFGRRRHRRHGAPGRAEDEPEHGHDGAGREQGRRQLHPGRQRGPSAPPDGHTLYFISTSSLITQPLHPDYPFDIMKFTPVTEVATGPLILVARNDLGVKTVRELIDLCNKEPGKIKFGMGGGVGSSLGVATELLKARTGIDINIVPYRGAAPALNDLLGGHIDAMFDAMPVMAVQAKEGKVTPLAVTGAKRSFALPDVPTIQESGLDYLINGWYGILAPPGTPPAIVQKLRDEAAKAVAPADVVKTLASQGMEPRGTQPAEWAKYLQSELAFYTKIIKDANIKPE